MKLLTIFSLISVLTFGSTVLAQSTLPKEVQADLKQEEIISALKQKDFNRANDLFAAYDEIGVDIPPPLILMRAKVAYQLKQYIGAKQYLETYLANSVRGSDDYKKALKMYTSIQELPEVKSYHKMVGDEFCRDLDLVIRYVAEGDGEIMQYTAPADIIYSLKFTYNFLGSEIGKCWIQSFDTGIRFLSCLIPGKESFFEFKDDMKHKVENCIHGLYQKNTLFNYSMNMGESAPQSLDACIETPRAKILHLEMKESLNNEVVIHLQSAKNPVSDDAKVKICQTPFDF